VNARPLTDEDEDKLRLYWARCAIFAPWATVQLPVGDKCAMGSYATREVIGVHFMGELLYKEIK
jgi:hypothetical protein